jgi:dihydroneopterin aldolase
MIEKIRLSGIVEYGKHGVYPHEKVNKQKFTVDLILTLNRTSVEDKLESTVDYDKIVNAVRDVIANTEFDLIESLAAQVAKVCLDFVAISEVEVTLHKPAAAQALGIDEVIVTVIRLR